MLIHDPSEVQKQFRVSKAIINNKTNLNFFGASMNSNEYKILKLKLCKIFQIPYNLIDDRWEVF